MRYAFHGRLAHAQWQTVVARDALMIAVGAGDQSLWVGAAPVAVEIALA